MLTCSGGELEHEGVIDGLEAHVDSISGNIAHGGTTRVGSQVGESEHGLFEKASGGISGRLKALGLGHTGGHELVRLENCDKSKIKRVSMGEIYAKHVLVLRLSIYL